MRRGILIIALLAAGCSYESKPRPATAAEPMPVLAVYKAAPSSALVFDAPVAASQPPLDLSRDSRAPGAFVGYDQGIATFYYVRTDDRQFNGFGGNQLQYERRAISTKVGVSYR
jgi:hypothetical protein